jgi:16S rRNA (cytosine1402-N4)-methyltransferase
MESYHTSVLLNESIAGLAIQPNGIYVDCTFGGGGHAKAILAQLTSGKLIAFDQDAEAIANKPNDNRLIMVHGNFRYLRNYLRYEGFPKVNGILADLGVSGHHFDSHERGFSFRFNAQLDMRMNQQASLSALQVINDYPLEQLISIFRQYGELDNAGRVGHLIVNSRVQKRIETVGDLKTVLEPATPQKAAPKYLAKVFQAIRIEVNQEMEALKEMLEQSAEVLLPGGKLVVITYHSLEDRLVKNYMKNGMFEGQPEKDLFGNVKVPFKMDNRKVIIAGDEELDENSRSRSAKLRIAERLK